jgi:hypothetical protein
VLQPIRDLHAHRLAERHESEQERRRGADARGEGEDLEVETGVLQADDVGGERGSCDRHEPHRDQNAGAAAERGKDGPFRQQLARHSQPSRAERDADGDFLLPPGRPRQEQVRDVAARDQQDERDAGEEQNDRAAELLDDFAVQRLNVRAVAAAELRHLFFDAAGDGGHFRLRLRDRDAVAQSRHYPQVMTAPIQLDRLGDRRPEVRRRAALAPRELEVRGHDSHHGMRDAIQLDRAAGDRRIGVEARAPQAVADDGDRAASRPIFVRRERPSKLRRDPHHREEPGCHARRDEFHRFAGAGQVVLAVEGDCRHVRERSRACLPLRKLVARDDVARVLRAAALPYHHDPIGIAEGKRPQQHRVDDAEHGGGAADAERHQHDGERRQRRRT